MPEVATEQTEVKEPIVPNPFDDSNWKEAGELSKPATQQADAAATTIITEAAKATLLDPKDYIKNEFGFDDIDAFKQVVEKGKNYKEPEPIKFENADSETAYNYLTQGKSKELRELLNRQAELEDAVNLPAGEAIKLQIKNTNPHYKAQDVEDVFVERYNLPAKPKQTLDETEDEYNERVAGWQQQADFVNRKIERDAFTAKQELQKLHSQLVLPTITKPIVEDANAIKPEKIAEMRQAYLSSIDSGVKDFNGYNVEAAILDGAVKLPITYGILDNERAAIKTQLEAFNIDTFVGSRWWNADGTPKTKQLADDLHLLQNKERVFQKIANDAASKAYDYYVQNQSNIKLNTVTHTGGEQRPAGKSVAEWMMEVG